MIGNVFPTDFIAYPARVKYKKNCTATRVVPNCIGKVSRHILVEMEAFGSRNNKSPCNVDLM